MGISKRTPEIDGFYANIGEKVRSMRVYKGYSQEKLAQKLNLTFQQIQKYERGTNRLPIFYMDKCCQIFGCNHDYFLETTETSVDAEGIRLLHLINKTVGQSNLQLFLQNIKSNSKDERCISQNETVE